MFKKIKIVVCFSLVLSAFLSVQCYASDDSLVFKVNKENYIPDSGEYYCENVLNSQIQRCIYGAIVSALSSFGPENIQTEFSLSFIIEDVWSYPLTSDEISLVLQCIFSDHPEFFWFYNVSYGTNFDFLKKTAVIELHVSATSVYSSISELINDIRCFSETAENIIMDTQAYDVYETIEYFNDWLCKNNTYNSVSNTDEIFDKKNMLVSALNCDISPVDGPVCQGYVTAFKFLCDRAEIPCVIIYGKAYKENGKSENHAWNAVMINDNWYGIDVTWNDTPYGNKFFLVGSNTVTIKHFGKKYDEFRENHVAGLLSEKFSLYYPELSKDEYSSDKHPVFKLELNEPSSEIVINNGYVINIPEQMLLSDVRLLFKHSKQIGVLWDGSELVSSEYVGTGSVIYINDVNNRMSEDAEIVVKGDVDGDARITVEDYRLIKKHVVLKNNLNGAAYIAADINNDNLITTVDYIKIKKVLTIVNKYDILKSVYFEQYIKE